ncbi:hypothetical protein CENSYa_2011 [Cenarchaeum symbiosum A]|uniref:Uncharacterized protein n=1 Tax=Cenarchaeum symbiosum (strain A) TaxID=414004 RepID=A0RZ48_CENSY|nr:hypothetical protein CENSYa_2011 [Cenarchaeum symbiosum A]
MSPPDLSSMRFFVTKGALGSCHSSCLFIAAASSKEALHSLHAFLPAGPPVSTGAAARPVIFKPSGAAQRASLLSPTAGANVGC